MTDKTQPLTDEQIELFNFMVQEVVISDRTQDKSIGLLSAMLDGNISVAVVAHIEYHDEDDVMMRPLAVIVTANLFDRLTPAGDPEIVER